jgi:heme exporter protein A
MEPTHSFTGAALACRRGGRLVFAGLDFALAAGQALVLRGPNGSGKSSLLRLMAGLIRAEAGVLAWDGQDALDDRETHAGRLHFVGHLDGTKLALTVAENIQFWARLRGMTLDMAALTTIIEPLRLMRLAAVPARLLSAGQRRRLALTRLIAAPAPLWLLDEPSVGLDDESLAAFETLLAAHRAGGGMVVAATHTAIALPEARELRLDAFARGADLDLIA